ncbi:N-(5'-phosphoribosyl)anthranilate isomerase [Candidatus Fermentibacteria bacterium]|nr:N-(5'-phosphoribosyl)anthranilate isomerase [Candidatus Fermentibacteria bacterium]
MVRVKICGITCLEDAMAASELGADAVGFVFADSPRKVSVDRVGEIVRAIPPYVSTVGVFLDHPPSEVKRIREVCGLDMVQLQGNESEEDLEEIGGRIVKAVHPETMNLSAESYSGALLLLDSRDELGRGGTGKTLDWRAVRGMFPGRVVILAGGLRPDNVEEAIRIVKPYAVDVCSGVESSPGKKDHGKIESFINRAKAP